jgi:hypothetical protein
MNDAGDAGWRTLIRWVIVDPRRWTVLLRAGAPASLPVTDHPGQVWSPEPEATTAVLRELVGFDVVMLRSAGEHDDDDERVRRTTVIAAPRGEVTPAPGMAWVGREGLDGAAPGDDAATAAEVLDGLSGGTALAARPPWEGPAWFGETERWLLASLERLGTEATGPVRQVLVWELSSVLRAPTPGGDVYLKASVDSPLFGDEGAMTALLAELYPDSVPAPPAVDRDRRLTLLADFGEVIGWNAPADIRDEALRAFARIQVDATAHTGRLLAAGFLDRRLDWLAAEARAWLPEIEATGRLPSIDASTWLSPEEMAEVRDAGPRLAELCAELATFAIPPSLVHGDLHLGNVAYGKRGGCLFFDWTDACVAHPFMDVAVTIEDDEEPVRRRRVDAYLAEWAAFEPPERLLRAWLIADPLSALHHAISYRSIVESLAPPFDQHMASSTASWLRRMLDRLPSDGAAAG